MHVAHLVFACAASLTVDLPRAEPPPAAELAEILDAFVPETMDAFGGAVPGLAVAVVRGEEAIYLRGFGLADRERDLPATPETAFYIASSTKSFTALAAALLDHEGVIDLDTSLAEAFPDVDFDPAVEAGAVPLRDLLTHTHGFDNGAISYRAAFTGEHTPEVMNALLARTEPRADAPRGTFRYSNVGYNVLSLYLDRVLEKPWQTLLDERVFTPLGMHHTTAYVSEMERGGWPVAAPYFGYGEEGPERLYLVKRDNTMQAAGGLYTTAADAARWLEAQLGEGRVDGRRALPAEVVHGTHQARAEADRTVGPFHHTGYALGWSVGEYDGELLLDHFGGFAGAHSHVSFLPERGLGVAVLANEADGGMGLGLLVATLVYDWGRGRPDALERARALRAEGLEHVQRSRERAAQDRATRAEREWTLSRPLEAYAGTYVNADYGTLRVTVEDGAPLVRLGNLQAVATPYTAPDTMRVALVPPGGSVVAFQLESDRAVRAVYEDEVFERVE